MQLTIELKGKFNPSHHKAVETTVRNLGAVSSQIKLSQGSEAITISVDSDKRHHLRGALQTIITSVKPTKTLLNGRETRSGQLLA